MKFEKAPIEGIYVIDLQKHGDDRGFFSRMFCQKEMLEQGLSPNLAQINDSYSAEKGTLRGMHYQLAHKAETKMVRCVRGAVLDIILDIRSGSKTFGEHFGVELTAENRRMLYVPKGFAHGFITLTDDTEVIYLVDEFYAPEKERIIRWNDPKFALPWPSPPTVMSDKDKSAPDFDPQHHLV